MRFMSKGGAASPGEMQDVRGQEAQGWGRGCARAGRSAGAAGAVEWRAVRLRPLRAAARHAHRAQRLGPAAAAGPQPGPPGPGLCEGPDRYRRPLARHRSEEHTSELQSPCNLVCRLLLEKKKK